VDSGCERSVTARSRRLVSNSRLTPSHYVLTMANKMDIPILEDMNLKFTVDGHRFKVDVSVTHEVDEFLLGSDWLPANHAKWDFADGTIILGDK